VRLLSARRPNLDQPVPRSQNVDDDGQADFGSAEHEHSIHCPAAADESMMSCSELTWRISEQAMRKRRAQPGLTALTRRVDRFRQRIARMSLRR
jgi:predicted nucleic acid-binding Zn ribbon protein